MIWLTWRQFRIQAVTAAAALAAFAVLLAVTGPHLASLYAADGLDRCHGSCLSPASYFTGSLSSGQRAQLALTVALAKRPELLILDEPVAALDPLARREFLQGLMEAVAEDEVSVVLSSHLVADLERVCDYLIVLVASKIQLAGEVSELLASHRRLSGPRRDPGRLPAGQEVVTEGHTDKQTNLLIRTDGPVLDPAWAVTPVSLEDLVLAYMSRAREGTPARRPRLGVAS